jgi:hypothetical protein
VYFTGKNTDKKKNAEEKFLQASTAHQQAIQQHLQQGEEEDEQEDDIADDIINTVFKSYTSTYSKLHCTSNSNFILFISLQNINITLDLHLFVHFSGCKTLSIDD